MNIIMWIGVGVVVSSVFWMWVGVSWRRRKLLPKKYFIGK